MKILAIMQNQWFKDPARMERMLRDTFKNDRPRFVKTFLFWSCRTGKELTAAFGEDLCDSIIWEEASPQIGGHASSSFPADPAHIRSVIDQHKPDLILAFGRIAWDVVSVAIGASDLFLGTVWTGRVLRAPHPCARGADTRRQLNDIADAVKSAIIGKAATC